MYQFLYTDVYVVEGYKKSKFYEPLKDLESIYISSKIGFEKAKKLIIIIVLFWNSRLSQLCTLRCRRKCHIFGYEKG